MGRESKTERCVEWEGRAKQRGVEWEGRAKQRDVLSGKGEQNREMW